MTRSLRERELFGRSVRIELTQLNFRVAPAAGRPSHRVDVTIGGGSHAFEPVLVVALPVVDFAEKQV